MICTETLKYVERQLGVGLDKKVTWTICGEVGTRYWVGQNNTFVDRAGYQVFGWTNSTIK